jgi:hypothetical protein
MNDKFAAAFRRGFGAIFFRRAAIGFRALALTGIVALASGLPRHIS